MENQALSNESPPDEPDLSPKSILAQMGLIEAFLKDGKKKTDKALLDSAQKYLQLVKLINSTQDGDELARKYKVKRRFVLLVLGTVFEQVFGLSKGRPISLASSLLTESKDALRDETYLLAELNVLGAVYLESVDSYLEALDYFKSLDKKRACELALAFNRYEDFLYLLKDETDPLKLVIGLPSDPFVGAIQSYLLGHQLWRAKVQQLVQKLKGFAPDLLASFSVKLGSVNKFPELFLQIAVEFGYEESLRVFSVPLLASICRNTDDRWCSKVPIGVVSDACQLLNSLQKTFKPSNGGHPSIADDFFCYSITYQALLDGVPTYLSSIKRYCTGKTPTLIRYNPDLSLFTLGRLFISQPSSESESPSDSEEDDVVLFKKSADFSADFEHLTLRKQHLATQAMSLPSAHLSFDLARSAFVIDTNVLVANPRFLESFYDLDARVYVPVIVLEELVMLADHPIAEKSSKARAALGWFDTASHPNKSVIKSIFASGRTSTSFDIKSEPDSLGTATNDDLILKICTILGKQQQAGGIFLRPVIISDDVNMRLKAKAMGIQAVGLESFSRATFHI